MRSAIDSRKASKLRSPEACFSPKADSSSPCEANPFMVPDLLGKRPTTRMEEGRAMADYAIASQFSWKCGYCNCVPRSKLSTKDDRYLNLASIRALQGFVFFASPHQSRSQDNTKPSDLGTNSTSTTPLGICLWNCLFRLGIGTS